LRVQAGATRLRSSAPYQDGRVEIQDLASQRVARFADARPGETALDYCAGGGGKTLALAMHMEGQGRLLAHDAAPPRMEELRRRAARAGLEVEIIGSEPATAPLACDLVLVDAPCSGSGAWRRQPDAKWRLTPAELARLQALQDQILALACRHVRPGGRLVYATCSLFEAENGDRVAAFLAARPDFRREAELRLTPLEGGDGFYACRLRPG
ncbi:MAG TPA: RsmB/NOP family class I SAM-dependent RNA methyltransferase, partial [Paracoccaceae bacterium]|nr:RsmB/NOP family class I SAM-dependent RNA methyltransferase [Paracoccaceae bacterium]